MTLAACLPGDIEVAARQEGSSTVPTPSPAPRAPSPTPPAPSPTPPAPSPTPPASSRGSITVSWTENTEADLQGYRVYYGTASGDYWQVRGAGIEAGRSTSFTISNLQVGTTYYIAVTAYDRSGNESAYSGEVSGTAR
ncbi:MAG: fibronectin type III domain-containing protein [Burkholderiaceae bacterium]|nr:fibronectin type III domain-containing protein [Burkholderiaceae bacterium]